MNGMAQVIRLLAIECSTSDRAFLGIIQGHSYISASRRMDGRGVEVGF